MIRNIILCAVATLGMLSVVAQDSASSQQVIEAILSNNLRLKAREADIAAQTTSIKAEARRLDETEIEFEHLWGDGEKRWNVGVTQRFDWPGLYAARRQGAEAAGAALVFLYDSECLEVRRQAMEMMEAYSYTVSRINLLDSVLANMTRLEAYIDEGYRQGQLTILDVKKIRLERFRLKSEITDLRQELNTYHAELMALNGGVDPHFDGIYPMPMLLPIDDYLVYARDNNPILKSSEKSSQAAMAQARGERQMPSFSVGYRQAYEDRTHYYGFSVGVGLPIFSRNKAGQIAKMQVQGIDFDRQAEISSAESAIRSEYASASLRLDQLKQLSDATLLEDYPALMLMAYKGGQINVITYIQEINYYIDAQRDVLAARHGLALALISLNRYNP